MRLSVDSLTWDLLRFFLRVTLDLYYSIVGEDVKDNFVGGAILSPIPHSILARIVNIKVKILG